MAWFKVDFKKPLHVVLVTVLLVVILPWAIFALAGLEPDTNHYGINKTIGWAYDFNNNCAVSLAITTCAIILMVIGYSVLSLFRLKLNAKISVLHIFAATLTFYLLLFVEVKWVCSFAFWLGLFCLALFFVSTVSAINSLLLSFGLGWLFLVKRNKVG